MKLNTTDFLHKAQHPLLMGLGSVPLSLLFVMNNAPELLARALLLPAVFVLLAWFCLLLPGRKRLAGGIIGAAALLAAGFVLLDARVHFFLSVPPLMYAGLLFATLPMGGWPRGRELNIAWYVIGVLLYVLMQLLTTGAQLAGTRLYDPTIPAVTLCFLGYAALLLLALNRASLESASMSRRTVPLLMRRQNTVLTFALMALALLIAAIPAIGSALGTVWDWLIQGLAMLGTLLSALLQQRQSGGGSAPAMEPDSLSIGEAAEPSALALFMEKAIGIIALIALIVLIFFAGRALIRKLIHLAKYLWGQLTHYSAAASEDYEDEITDTRDEADVERQSLLTRLRRMAPADEKSMTPTERVRYRYKRLKHRHSDWSAAATARETLPEQAAALYERARYGGESLTEEDAGNFRDATKKI